MAPRRDPAVSRYERLTALDLMFLRIECEAWPSHFGGLAVVDGSTLVDASGRLRLDEIVERLGDRLGGAPRLRQRVRFTGPLQGKPVWVDDDTFDLRRHVRAVTIGAPGGETELLEAASRVCEGLLDRSRPLWEIWLLTGLQDGRLGVLLKLHHAVADGLGAVALMGGLFDEAQAAAPPLTMAWKPRPAPTRTQLFADALASAAFHIRSLTHPARAVRTAHDSWRAARRALSQTRAPRTSLNRRVGTGRRVRFVQLDLADVKDVAHAIDARVNDVVLTIWAGGLRELLVSRGEPVDDVELVATVPVSLRSSETAPTAHNELGVMGVRLPVWEPDPLERLALVTARSRYAKAEQHPAAVMRALAALSATPAGRFFAARQRAANVEVTNVAGPPFDVHLLDARVLEILPIVQPLGNMGPTLCAFSYAGRLFLVVTADAASNPDLDVLMAALRTDWERLRV